MWPWVDEWLAWFTTNLEDGATSLPELFEHINLRDIPPSDEDRRDLAAQGFLRLMVELRIVILQDSVLLRREFLDHPILKSPVFSRPDYLAFAQEVERSLQNYEEPEDQRIRRVFPDIANRLSTQTNMLRSIDESHQDIRRLIEQQSRSA